MVIGDFQIAGIVNRAGRPHQVAANTRRVRAPARKRSAIEPTARYLYLFDMSIGSNLDGLSAPLARVLRTVRMTVIEDVVAPGNARHAAMVVAQVHHSGVLGLVPGQATSPLETSTPP